MNCNETREKLNAYVDGELNARGRSTVEAHLQGCEHCRMELASLRALSDRTRFAAVSAPQALMERVQAGISSSRPRPREVLSMKTRLSIGFGAAAVAAIAFVALRPTDAQADIAGIKKALTKAPHVHAVTVDAKNNKVREAWKQNGEWRFVMGKIVAAAKAPTGKVALRNGQAQSKEIEVKGVKISEGDLKLKTVADVPLDVVLSFEAVKPPAEGGVWIAVEGTPLKDKIPYSGTLEISLDASKNVKRVFVVDKKTKLPLAIEQRRKSGKAWTLEYRTNFDYTKSAPKGVFKGK